MEYQLITPSIPLRVEVSAVERVLTNRGIKLSDIDHFLNTTDEDILNPKTIMNIQQGAKMLVNHIGKNDDIFIQVDSDCDGLTSAALLINYINMIAPAYAQTHIFYRLHEGKQHGLILDTIPENIKLVIAPDSSSNDFEEHEYLKIKRNIDVLVIDHHEAEKISEISICSGI